MMPKMALYLNFISERRGGHRGGSVVAAVIRPILRFRFLGEV